MKRETGIRLEQHDGVVLAETFEEVNAKLATDGIRAWPADLSDVPNGIRRLLAQETLTDDETDHVKAQFLLSRERLL